MGALDKDLCLFWKSVADANITFLTTALISFEFFEDQLEVRIDRMLGKGKLAKLRALSRAHGLASGSQTVPNSVVEIAAAQGRSPPQGPAPSEAQPANQCKKLVLRKPKRKTPRVVHEDEEEDDEATEDGLITKRKRVAPSSPPGPPPPPTSTPPSTPAPPPKLLPAPAPTSPVQAVPLASALPVVEAAEPNFMENPPSASTPYVSARGGPPSNASTADAAPGGNEGAHNSPILITESPTSPPRQEAPIQQPTQEGGGENQQQAPPVLPKTNLSLELQDDISVLQEENRTIRIEAEKLSCNLMLAEIDHSRVEDAMSTDFGRHARRPPIYAIRCSS
ncbi:predicted GPI-anchored protein 58 [Phaseolus vulgaris]|uniref:predicted GPI-anchored protein 58 n=1 Tax=Phaseolus vulgaris TaxID=3885 RepID=UPI0035CC8C4A